MTTSAIPNKVADVLAAHGLEALEFEPGSTPTSQAAAARLGVEVGQIAKSILLKGKNGSYYMVVCAGDRRIDNKLLRKEIGVKARMATAEETEAQTGFRPGGVCPFGVEGVAVLVDQSLERFAQIYPAAGTDASGVPMTFDQLCLVAQGARCDVTAAPAPPVT